MKRLFPLQPLRLLMPFFVSCAVIGLPSSVRAVDSQADTYPYALRQVQDALGGQFIAAALDESDTLAFVVRRRSALGGDANVIQVWSSLERRADSAGSLAGAHIAAATRLDRTRLLVLTARRDTLVLASLGADLTPHDEQILPGIGYTPGLESELIINAARTTVLLRIDARAFTAHIGAAGIDSVRPAGLGQVFAVRPLPSAALFCAGGFAVVRQVGLQREVLLLDSLARPRRAIDSGLPEPEKLALIGNTVIVAIDPLGDFTNLAFLNYEDEFAGQLATVTAKWYNIGFGPPDVFYHHVRYVEFNGSYRWVRRSLPVRGGNSESEVLHEFPPGFVTPIGVDVEEGVSFVAFRNGFVTLDNEGVPLSANRFNVDFASDAQVRMQAFGDLLTATQNDRSWLFRREENDLWWLNQLVRDFWAYLLILTVLTIILLTTRYAYSRRRLLSTLFEMDGADAFLVLDRQSRLRSLNETARGLLRLPAAVPLRRLFSFYCAGLRVKGLVQLAEEALRYRAPLTRRISFEESGTDFLFSAFPIRGLFGNLSGLLLTGRDITEELEKKKLNNWAQLAHDMKTNLSIIKLNAENLSELPETVVRGLGTRILFQVNLLINRVRDLVAIGASDALETSPVDVHSICDDVRREFESDLFPNVTLRVDSVHLLLNCDRRKLERALRNAVENGIRALHGADGAVDIRAWYDARFVYFEVRDSGVGMDKETLDNMSRPFFTRYQQQGGTGMGTMIMQHVMQLHGGAMEVESNKGRGTVVRFRLPNLDTRAVAERRALRPHENGAATGAKNVQNGA